MTPEREADIRAWVSNLEHRTFYAYHWTMANHLLAEIDKLRELRINSQLRYDVVLEEYAALKQAAIPFMNISVPVNDILNLRKVLKGS